MSENEGNVCLPRKISALAVDISMISTLCFVDLVLWYETVQRSQSSLVYYNIHTSMSLSYDTNSPKVKVPVHSSSAPPLRDWNKGFAVLDCHTILC